MPSQQRSRAIDRNAARERRAARAAQQESKAVRAQMRTMEAREAETRSNVVAAAASADAAALVPGGGTAATARRAAAVARNAVARPKVLTKEQEYRFIRHDLRRLATTAGILFVAMIVLLFVVD